MKTTIDKAGRVAIPAQIRERAGFKPGTELEVIPDDVSVRLIRRVPGPSWSASTSAWSRAPACRPPGCRGWTLPI